MIGNCVDFVTRADQLGALYRSELKKLPGSEASLKTTIWWCEDLTNAIERNLCIGAQLQTARGDHKRGMLAAHPECGAPRRSYEAELSVRNSSSSNKLPSGSRP